MKERPILFNSEMVRAILEGQKTQTRRVIKHQPPFGCAYAINGNRSHALCFATAGSPVAGSEIWVPPTAKSKDHRLACPFGQPGDRLWVRETWGHNGCLCCPIHYRATDPDPDTGNPYFRWYPSIHMMRSASRITLEITNVRVERLNKITRGEAMEEGCPFSNMAAGIDPRDWFSDLWESINGAGSWSFDPWVWVIEFRKVEDVSSAPNSLQPKPLTGSLS